MENYLKPCYSTLVFVVTVSIATLSLSLVCAVCIFHRLFIVDGDDVRASWLRKNHLDWEIHGGTPGESVQRSRHQQHH